MAAALATIATPRRHGPALALAAVVCAGAALFAALTGGFRTVTSDGMRRLELEQAPRPLPAVALLDSRSRRFPLDRLAQIDGDASRVTVIMLGYTYCVEICRTTASGLAYLQQELRARGLDKRVRLLTISFDPARDTPAALDDYSRKLNADPAQWTFATVAAQADLARLLKPFDIVVLPDGMGGYVHNGAFFVADSGGRLIRAYDIDRPDQVLADLLPD